MRRTGRDSTFDVADLATEPVVRRGRGEPVVNQPEGLPMRHKGLVDHASTVFVIEPDGVTGKMIQELLAGTDLKCELFRSAREFFAAYQDHCTGCLVLDTLIPDMGGLQIQRRLASQQSSLPLVFVVTRLDVSTAVELMRSGAIHVLEKPVRSVELWNAIQEAVETGRNRHRAIEEQRQVRERLATLTRKERQVLQLIAEGKSIKAIAVTLNVCVRAVELRRRNLMKKLDLKSQAELMRFSVLADIEFRKRPDPALSDESAI